MVDPEPASESEIPELATPESAPGAAIQRFATLLRDEWAKLDAAHDSGLDGEDLLDVLWLAQQISSAPTAKTQASLSVSPTVNQEEGEAAPASSSEPKVSIYSSPPDAAAESASEPESGLGSGLGSGLPIQVPGASALRSQLDLARALRPLMRKIPSPTQRQLDETATAIQIMEQGVWSPVLVPAPERWFDLALVVEAGASLILWQETIAELQTLLERQGAFRQIRTWRLTAENGEIALLPNWNANRQAANRSRSAKSLLDPTRRRLIWLVSDCTSELWDRQPLYDCLADWGKQSPLAVLQLFPERLWPRTALGIGQPVRLKAGIPGATQAQLTARVIPLEPLLPEPESEPESEGSTEPSAEPASRPPDQSQPANPPIPSSRSIVLPVISLEPEPLDRWAKLTTGMADVSLVALQVAYGDLVLLSQPVQTAGNGELLSEELSPEQRVRQFCATASILAQRLAGLMAAVPVSLPVVYLIQRNLLPQSRQVHVAEVFMGGLLERVPSAVSQSNSGQSNSGQSNSGQSSDQTLIQYRFPEPVRELLVDLVPISKTTRVLDLLSADIAQRLGLGTKSFTALIAALPRLGSDQQQSLQAFAELGISTLKRLGGDYRQRAEQLAQYLPPEPSPEPPPEPNPGAWPPWQDYQFRVAQVEVERLRSFEFETAKIQRSDPPESRSRRSGRQPEPSQPNWVITKSSGTGWQRIEDLGNGVLLELVEIPAGRFWMGSPEGELERQNSEGPQHLVSLKSFFMGMYPVTQAQWRAVAGFEPQKQELDPDPSQFKGANRPVERVSWRNAVEFCARLSAKTGRPYRLPTEAEWEYACRALPIPLDADEQTLELAKATAPFAFGETITPDLANYNGTDQRYGSYGVGPKGVRRGETTEVGSFAANAFGLFDMHGNVWEWCADHWHDNYAEKPEDLKQNGNMPWLSEGENKSRLLRGGSWILNPRDCRSAYRYLNLPVTRDLTYGFRVVCGAART